LTNLLLIRHSQ